eukprot:TRINITY_DN59193_c0_g1_i1.p1 TRINITY_DN59193_c0_g1~~TRINITY_DN59193_c0_g1_i1.p1  ORF type:complete len:560 (+),score=75.37 TRINITY_DN59193_c0_g1_i1:43-1722(+)
MFAICAFLVGNALADSISAGDQPLLTDVKVAVLEHTIRWGSNYDATETIQLNLDVYEHQARKAAAYGAQLMVTPEYGITGYPGGDREWWWPFGTDIPEHTGHLNPCEDRVIPLPNVLRRLSCMAKQYKLAIVASLIDMKDCSRNMSYPGCRSSRDGWLLLNTDVVFDSDGVFLAKYHKTNKWGEHPVDAPADCKAVTFTPRAIALTFGLFTCADLIHSWPTLHLVSQGVRHFAMPLGWTNEMNQFQPLGWLQSWSRMNNVSLLAANARDKGKETGSGIFSRGEVVSTAYSITGELDELLLSSIPRLPPQESPPKVCPRSAGRAKIPQHSWSTVRLDMTPGVHIASRCSVSEDGEENPLCCELHYEVTATGDDGGGYVLAVLNGRDAAPGIAPWIAQTCAVLPCVEKRIAPDGNAYTYSEFLDYFGRHDGQEQWRRSLPADQKSCLEYPARRVAQKGIQSFGGFAALKLRGNFSSTTTVFPILMAGPQRLLPTSKLSNCESTQGRCVQFKGPFAAELFQLQLYGRLFMKDEGYPKCACGNRNVETWTASDGIENAHVEFL